MASYTENLNLKKPERTDKFSIEDYNDNLDKLDKAISGNGAGYPPQEAAVYSEPAPEVIFAMPVEEETED